MPVEILKGGDESLAEQFLAQHPETSMILRSNIYRDGLEHQGDYYASFTDGGEINGVLAYYASGNVIIQAPDEQALSDLIHVFRHAGVRSITGLIGPDDQVTRTLSALSIPENFFACNKYERLYGLDLKDLQIPKQLGQGWNMKPAREAGAKILHAWMKAFEIETLGAEDNNILEQRMQARVKRTMTEPDYWILEVNGAPVSTNSFNARIPDSVQIGSVYTPPEHRGCGYARALLAMVLQSTRAQGVQKAVLFTNTPAAEKAYQSIGFNRIGSYRIALLKQPIELNELANL